MAVWKIALQFATAVAGCFGFAIVFHVGRNEWLVASFGGAVSWAAYLLMLSASGNDYVAAFVGSAASAFYGEMIARKVRAPATVFTVIAFVPLIPGASLYRAADALMNGHSEEGRRLAVYTLAFAACMSAGVVSEEGRRLAVYTLAFAACMSAGVVVTTLILRKMGKVRAGRISG